MTASDWGFVLIAIGLVVLMFIALIRADRLDFEDWLKKRRGRR